MSTITDLKAEIEGAFALAAMHTADGNFATAANFMRQVDELREELEEVETR